jgi:hypothetical protein
MLVALIGLGLSEGLAQAIHWLWLPILLAILAAIWAGGAFKASAGQIYETESAYNYIQVIEFNGTRYLRLNEGQGVHSIYNPDQLDFQGTWEQFLAAPYFNSFDDDQWITDRDVLFPIDRIAVIGLAGGTTARQATEVFGAIPIDGFEIDARIIAIGQEYFGMTMANLNPIAQDGRWGLEHSDQLYSLIEIDAYRPPYIPPHLTTLEFFQLCRDHLTEDGVIAMNVGRTPEDRSLVDALATTLAQVFPSVHVMDVPNSFNSIIYATVQSTSFENLQLNYDLLSSRSDVHPLLLASIERTLVNRREMPTDGILLTDERAPVEWIVNKMVLNFLGSEGVENLQ